MFHVSADLIPVDNSPCTNVLPGEPASDWHKAGAALFTEVDSAFSSALGSEAASEHSISGKRARSVKILVGQAAGSCGSAIPRALPSETPEAEGRSVGAIPSILRRSAGTR
jgi:hypothetical protein